MSTELAIKRDFIIDPTMTAYLAGRDVMKERDAEWHKDYTLPSLWDFYTPNRENQFNSKVIRRFH